MGDSTLELLNKRGRVLAVAFTLGAIAVALISLLFPSIMTVTISVWFLMATILYGPMIFWVSALRYARKKPYVKEAAISIGLFAALFFGLNYFMPAAVNPSILIWGFIMGITTVFILSIFSPIIIREMEEPGWFNRVYRDEPMEAERAKWEENPTLLATLRFMVNWIAIPKRER